MVRVLLALWLVLHTATANVNAHRSLKSSSKAYAPSSDVLPRGTASFPWSLLHDLGSTYRVHDEGPAAFSDTQSILAGLDELRTLPARLRSAQFLKYITSNELKVEAAQPLFRLASNGPEDAESVKSVCAWLAQASEGVKALADEQEVQIQARVSAKQQGVAAPGSPDWKWPGTMGVSFGLSYALLRRMLIGALMRARLLLAHTLANAQQKQSIQAWEAAVGPAALNLAHQVGCYNGVRTSMHTLTCKQHCFTTFFGGMTTSSLELRSRSPRGAVCVAAGHSMFCEVLLRCLFAHAVGGAFHAR